MTEVPQFLTLEQIKSQFPLKWEVFNRDSEDEKRVVEARVSRNKDGVIVYVVPGSTRVAVNRWFPGISKKHNEEFREIFGDKKEE